MDKKQIAFEKAVLDAHRNLSDGAGLSFYNIFKAGYASDGLKFEKV